MSRAERRSDLLWVIGLFAFTRVLLGLVGVASRILLEPFHGDEYVWEYSSHLWLDIWGVWDSGWYLGVAGSGYPSVEPGGPAIADLPRAGHYGFFPLYPAAVALVRLVVGDLYVSALVVSNLALLIASWLLLRLVEERSDRATARRAVKYLYLFPASYLLSGAFSEALCLALVLACFLQADRGHTARAGIAGFFLALSRPVGVLMVIPLALHWWIDRRGRAGASFLWLALIPLGLGAWAAFNHAMTGDALAFVHMKVRFWEIAPHDPLGNVADWLVDPALHVKINALFAVVEIGLILLLAWRREWVYVVVAALLFVTPIASGGIGQSTGIVRFAVLIFPYYVLLAELGRDERVDQLATIALGITLGFMMVFWANGFAVVV